MLKGGATHSGVSLQQTGSQCSELADLGAGLQLPPPKRSRADEDEELEEVDEEDYEIDLEPSGQFVTLSDATATFLEVAFSAKLCNNKRKTKATIPDSRWIRCPKIDAVVAANVSPAAQKVDRGVSHLQQFWLDAVTPLVMILEKVEDLDIPAEVITSIQTSLQLMGKVNYHNLVSRRNVLLTQLNPRLKPLFNDADFKDSAPYLFGDNFDSLAKQRLGMVTALKKTAYIDRGSQRGFQRGHPQKTQGRRGGGQFSSQYRST